MINPILQQPQEADLYEVIFGKFKLFSLLIGAAFKAGANIKSITTEKNDFFTNFFLTVFILYIVLF